MADDVIGHVTLRSLRKRYQGKIPSQFYIESYSKKKFRIGKDARCFWVSPCLIDCPAFRDNYSSLWSNLKTKIINFNHTDSITISYFITCLDPHEKVLLLLGGLSLSFDDASLILIKRSVASAFGKIHKLRTVKLRKLRAPWLTK